MKSDHLYISLRSEICFEKWNCAAASFKGAWFWHHTSAIDGYDKWDSYSDISFAILNSNKKDSIVAMVPLHKAKTILPFFYRLESTGGPAFLDSLEPKEIKTVSHLIKSKLMQLSIEHNATRIDLSISPLSPLIRSAEWPMINPLIKLGAIENSTMSWLLNLSNASIEELWMKIAQRTRKAVNKSRRQHYTFREAKDSDLNIYMRLHASTSKRNNLPEKPRSYAENIFTNLIPHGLAKIYIAEKDGFAEAFHSFAIYKGAANYWTTGCTLEALQNGVNNFLLWEAICALKADNIQWLECGEALPNSGNIKLQRINDFKRSFGGELFPYYRGSIITNPILEAVLSVFRAIKLKVTN